MLRAKNWLTTSYRSFQTLRLQPTQTISLSLQKETRSNTLRISKQCSSDLVRWTLRPYLRSANFIKRKSTFQDSLLAQQESEQIRERRNPFQSRPEPKNVKDVQLFLRLANYNRKFVKDYLRTATLLTNLTKKDIEFVQGSTQRKAFSTLKESCSLAPTLQIFDLKKPIQVEIDISDRAIGACLTQETGDKGHPIAYFLRKITLAEQNYKIYDKGAAYDRRSIATLESIL